MKRLFALNDSSGTGDMSMEVSCYEALAARIIGHEVLKYLKEAEILKGFELKTESKALQILEEIRCVRMTILLMIQSVSKELKPL